MFIRSIGGLKCIPNPLPEKKVRILWKSQKGKSFRKPNKKYKLAAYYAVGRGKLLPLDTEHKKLKYKNVGDEVTRIYNRAYKTYLKKHTIKGPEIKRVVTYTGRSTDPAFKRKKVELDIKQKLIQHKIHGKKIFTEQYEYLTSTKINQKDILERLKLNQFYKSKKFKNVNFKMNVYIYDREKKAMEPVFHKNLNIKDLKKSITESARKWPDELRTKFEINVVNHIYFMLRKALATQNWSMSSQAYKFKSEIKQQSQKIKLSEYGPITDKSKKYQQILKRITKGKDYIKVPGRKLRLLNNFRVNIEINYNK